jgi:hypothetical protein
LRAASGRARRASEPTAEILRFQRFDNAPELAGMVALEYFFDVDSALHKRMSEASFSAGPA